MSSLNTIKKNKDFKRVYKTGMVMKSDYALVVYVRETGKGKRFGFSVSKRLGKAVVRNRIKRLLKEICRKEQDFFPDGYDYVIVARAGAIGESYKDLSTRLINLIKRL